MSFLDILCRLVTIFIIRMKFHKNKMLATFTAVALALAVGACSSSSDDVPVASDPPPAGPTVGDLFTTAYKSEADAAAAVKEAEAAVEAATDASVLITTLGAKGDSMTATMNAQTVLNAPAKVGEAVAKAKTALENAEKALEDAKEIAADNAILKAVLDAAIIAAKGDLKTATGQREGEDLKNAVAMVEGEDEEKPKSADDIGEAVAMDVGGALMPADDGARGARAPHVDTAVAPNETAVRMDDHTGKTWAEIVGDDALKDMRIATSTPSTSRAVKAASFADMPLVAAITTNPPSAETAITDGMQFDGFYKGIPGVVFCTGDDCKVEGETDSEKLTGSWYFTTNADNAKTYYEKVGEADDTYTAETNYAQFGYWLSAVSETDAAIMVNTYAMVGDDATNTSDNAEWGVDTEMLTDTSATYSGDAVGMSLHKTTDVDGEITSIYSGRFDADVTLTATFGGTPMLGGTIDNFRGKAVDPKWTVELKEAPVTAGGVLSTVGVTVASADNGVWSASSYGEAAARPTGIFGGFSAHFSDGHAAGAFGTRK